MFAKLIGVLLLILATTASAFYGPRGSGIIRTEGWFYSCTPGVLWLDRNGELGSDQVREGGAQVFHRVGVLGTPIWRKHRS